MMQRKTIHVDVNHADIANGEPRSGDACPILLATRRVEPTVQCVGHTFIHFARGVLAPAPHEARQFIREFDAGRPVSPIAFDLEIEVIDAGD
jgi:hypothetical protein